MTDARRLLVDYFEDPSDEHVEKLEAVIAKMSADPSLLRARASALRANNSKFIGQLWREVLMRRVGRQTTPELAAVYVAASTFGYPRPRPYCPDDLVGTWKEVEPENARWELGADGKFVSTNSVLAECTAWCVQRVGFESFIASALHCLPDKTSSPTFGGHTLVVSKRSVGELSLKLVKRTNIAYTLVR
jgi:hypothetical protein